MSLGIGEFVNPAMSVLSLNKATVQTQKVLSRLSSGSRIVETSDDAAGAAVALKLEAAINRCVATETNLQNADSFLRTQASALDALGKGVTRLMELKTLSLDPTKDATDIANYSAEFSELRKSLFDISQTKFNGVDLFSHTGVDTYLDTTADESGQQTIRLTQYALGTKITEMLSDKSKLTFLWADYPNGISETKNKVRGTLAGSNFTYTLTDLNGTPMNLSATDGVERAPTFPTRYNIPATDRTIANSFASINTLTFDAPILNPILMFASIGQGGIPVGITFDRTVTVEFQTSVTINSPSRVTGDEGYLIARLDGWIRSFSFRYEDDERFCNFAFGAYTQAADEPLVTLSGDWLVQTLQYIGNCLANNGAEATAVGLSSDNIRTKSVNLESAKSKITDTDVARETQNLSKAQVLSQISAAMVKQSTEAQKTILKLIEQRLAGP
jgi:flagellin-like hook-associated protein FlgL